MQTLSSDTNQYSLLNGTDTQQERLSSEQKTAGSLGCMCITETCNCSIHPSGKDEWIASMLDSLAKIFQSPAMAKALKESEADSGKRLKGSLAKFNPKNSTWKTVQQSLLEDSTLFLETWPSWGMTLDGVCYLRPELVPRTYELDGGALQGVPTVTVHGNYNRKGLSKSSGDGLSTWVNSWPTPTASAYKGTSKATLTRKNGKSRERDRLDHAVMAQMLKFPTPRASDKNGHQIAPGRQGGDGLNQRIGGQLNPAWVEWLMGWPIGATELNASETDKSHCKQQ